MYKITAKSLGLKSDFAAVDETKEGAMAQMFQWLEVHHPEYIGDNSIQRLAEIDAILTRHIVPAEDYFGKQ